MHPVEALLSPIGRLLRTRRPDEAASIANAPELATSNRLTLTSPAFRDGDVVPAKHCGVFIGKDVSPALTWSALPEGTQGLVLVFEDLDSPGPTPAIHTIAAFAPIDGGLAEGALTPTDPRFVFLPRPHHPAAYIGPRPLPGHGTHHYRFHLYALDAVIDFTQVTDMRALPSAVAGHVLAAGTLGGTRTS